MDKKRIKAFVDAAILLRQGLSDEQAAEVPALYPEWKPEVEYATGDRIMFNGILYRVLSGHGSQADWTPDTAVSLFAKVLIPDDNKIYPWEQPDSTNPYMTNDKVSHNGSTWISIVDNNVWEPGVYGWEQVIG